MDKDRSKILNKILPCAGWILLWWALSLAAGDRLILPGPSEAFGSLLKLASTGRFWLDVLSTSSRVAAGMILSMGLGSAAAVAAGKSKAFREVMRIPVGFLKSIPVMAIIIYLILVLESGHVAVAVCFLMCFPIAYTNILNGLDGMDGKFDELARIYGMTPGQRRALIVRPLLKPEIKSAADLIAGMSWKVVVAAEVLSIPGHSIGYRMLDAKYYLETSDLFAYMAVLIILGICFEKLVDVMVELDGSRAGKRLEKEMAKRARPEAGGAGTGKEGPHGENAVKVSMKDVNKSFSSEAGEKKVLDGFGLELAPGITSLLGPSGSGKTTVMRLITGLEKQDSGEVKITPEGTRPDVLFQEDRLLPWLTVRENILLSFLGRGGAYTLKEINEKVDDAISKLELTDSRGLFPGELSGGMAHRTALGRAIAPGSPLLILDEPIRGLDSALTERILGVMEEDIRTSEAGQKRTVLLITHDEGLAERMSDAVVRMA